MANLGVVLDNRIGLRTFVKSFEAYTKAKAGKNHRSLGALLIDGKTRLNIQKNAQIINKGCLTMGLKPDDFFPSTRPCTFTMLENSKLILNGTVRVGRGVIIEIQKSACLEIGKNVCVNSNVSIICAQSIKIGDNTGIGWDTEICDTDYHQILREGAVITAPIEIGSHVFIGRRILIMKGVKIGDGSVIAAGAIVTRDVPPKCLVGGVPARVIKQNIDWQ